MKNDVADDDFEGNLIRRTRYVDAILVNLSIENKDVTFTASPPDSFAKKGLRVSKWAYYRKSVELTLVEAIDSERNVSILVYRYRITTKGKDRKPNYDLYDVIVSATMSD